MKKSHKQPRRKSEAESFRVLMMRLRKGMRWSQDDLGAKLGVSRRTLSNWENGYWLPPFKQRLHVVLSLRDAPPEYVLAIADALGVSVDPLVKPLLQSFRAALEGQGDGDVAASPAPPRPTAEQVRAALDAVVREAADALDARPNDVRAVLARALEACDALGASVEDIRAAAAPLPRATKTEGAA